jgi:hypothetical protein
MKKIATLFLSMMLLVFAGLSFEADHPADRQVIETEMVMDQAVDLVEADVFEQPSIVFIDVTSPFEPEVNPDDVILHASSINYRDLNLNYTSPHLTDKEWRYRYGAIL